MSDEKNYRGISKNSQNESGNHAGSFMFDKLVLEIEGAILNNNMDQKAPCLLAYSNNTYAF